MNASGITSGCDDKTIWCCIPIEFIQPWDQSEAIRQVKQLALGNMVVLSGTFHVGNSEQDRRLWKERFPSLAKQVDAVPRFPERPRHGMAVVFNLPLEFHLEQLRLCRELGLKVFAFFPALMSLPPEDFQRVMEAGRGIVFSECFMAENLSILASTLSVERLKEIDATAVASHAERNRLKSAAKPEKSIFDEPESLDFRAVHDWLVNRFRRVGDSLRALGVPRLSAVEASSQIRLALEAGADVPILELVPLEPLRGLAATRGAARAWGKPLWGVHTALGYYRNPASSWTAERLAIAYNLFFAAGASLFSEPNMPLRNWGLCSGFFTIPASPGMQDQDIECRDFTDPICVRAREVVAEHYRFARFHERPAGGPRVPMGYLLGYLDGWTGGESDRMWLADLPGFAAPDALKTWRHFDRAFESEHWYVPPRRYYWQADPVTPLRFGTPPCGQLDIVPIEAAPEALQSYRCLTLLGWNTMTAAHYEKLKQYVSNGGVLFLGVPHLDTRTRTDRPHSFYQDGDVRDLCGVRILGPGETVEEIFTGQHSSFPGVRFPRGALYLESARMAALELWGARVLAFARDNPHQAVLLEHRVGRGVVYLLANWEYPGERLDAFLTDVLRELADAQQAEVAVEGRDVFYALYDGTMPAATPFCAAYLVNTNIYGQPVYPMLHVQGRRLPVRVPGYGMRIAWILHDLMVAPHDRFVKITDARPEPCGWFIALESQMASAASTAPVERLIQCEALTAALRTVTLDGQALAVSTLPEGDHAFRCNLSGRQTLRVEFA